MSLVVSRFFGLFLAATNALEIGIELSVSRWLIPRLGVPTANLLHPLLSCLSFLGLALVPRLPVAVAARVNRETLENALANPLRNLSYNALPRRFRGRVRDRKSTRLNSSHMSESRMPSSA